MKVTYDAAAKINLMLDILARLENGYHSLFMLRLENQKKVISWRRIARAIEKNDFYMKRLCFAQTKADDKELEHLIHKWDNLLNKSTKTDDKGLTKFINEKFA